MANNDVTSLNTSVNTLSLVVSYTQPAQPEYLCPDSSFNNQKMAKLVSLYHTSDLLDYI